MTRKRTAIGLFFIMIMLMHSLHPVYAEASADAKIKAANKAIKELQGIGLELDKSNKTNLDKTITEKQVYDLLTDLGCEQSSYEEYSNKTMTISSYLTKILGLLGYIKEEDSLNMGANGYLSPINKATAIGLINKNEYTTKSKLLRADGIILFRRALELDRVADGQSLKYILTGNTKYWINTRGKGNNCLIPGVFYEEFNPGCELEELVILDSDDSFNSNLSNLNEMLFSTFQYAFGSAGSVYKLWQYGQPPYYNSNAKSFAEISHVTSTDQYKVTVNYWRDTYNSKHQLNEMINSILQTFYYLTGDKEVAYALFAWIDDEVIHGYKDPKNFGFHNVDVKGKSGTIEMNGIRIKFENTKDHNSYYFMNCDNSKVISASAGNIDKAKDYKLNAKIRDKKTNTEDVYYKIQTTNNNSYYYFRSRTNSSEDYVKYKLLDEGGLNTIAEFSTDKEEGKLYIKLNPNSTYYLVAGECNEDSVEYILNINEIKDDFADNLEVARDKSSVEINKAYTRLLETKDDIDYIKFKTGASGDYAIHTYILEELSLDFNLYDENGNPVAYDQVSNRQAYHMYAKVKLKPETTYYLKVKFKGYSKADYKYKFSIVESKAVTLNKTSVTIAKGKTFTLKLSSKIPTDSVDYITWYPRDYDVAITDYECFYNNTTDKVIVTGLKKGKTEITCTYTLNDGCDIILTCEVTVK